MGSPVVDYKLKGGYGKLRLAVKITKKYIKRTMFRIGPKVQKTRHGIESASAVGEAGFEKHFFNRK